MNKKMKWMDILAQNKNYSEEDFIRVVTDNCYKNSTTKNSIQKELMIYRNSLLKQMDTPNFDEKLTKDNVQKWFLQPIDEDNFDILIDLMQKNYWNIEELWKECREQEIGIFTLVKCLNTNINFKEGMKIYRNGKLINELSAKDEKQIVFIKNDKLFNASEFLNDLAYYSVPIALSSQIKKIRTERMKNEKIFELTKENVEYLNAEPISIRLFVALKQAMKINNWTLKELVKESLKLDMNIFIVSGIPNQAKEGTLYV